MWYDLKLFLLDMFLIGLPTAIISTMAILLGWRERREQASPSEAHYDRIPRAS